MRLLPTGTYADGHVVKEEGWLSTANSSYHCEFSCHLRESGAVFIGETKGGAREGYGELWLPDGGGFKGMWKDNQKHGQGTYFNAGGSMQPRDIFLREGNFDHYMKRQSTVSGLLSAFNIPSRR